MKYVEFYYWLFQYDKELANNYKYIYHIHLWFFKMNCHQIVSGACNAGDRCFAVGSVEGVSFTVSNSIKLFFWHFIKLQLIND